MARPSTHKPEQVVAAVEKHKGNVSFVANELGVTTRTVYAYREKWAAVREALDDQKTRRDDRVELAIDKAIDEGNTAMIIFYAKTQMKYRGYVERQELTGENGQPFQIEQKVQVNSGTDHITAVLRTLVEVGAVELPATSASGDAETDPLHPAPTDA